MNRFRHEYKYRINNCQKVIIDTKIKGIMLKDSHTDNSNKYVVRSLYLDNINNDCLKENIDGVDSRVKYRIRYYNNDLSFIQLEKKIKKRSLGIKESCQLSIEECKSIINGVVPMIRENDNEVKRKLLKEIKDKGMMPKIIVTYTRTPYIYPIGNIRITFDEDITSSKDIRNFLQGQYIQRPIMELGELLLEVKWDELLPKHLKEIIALDDLTWTAFSKYTMCSLINY